MWINIEHILKIYPNAKREVLEFINTFMNYIKPDEDNNNPQELLHNLFRSGYCYHFAHMLKVVFNRGEVCWAAPFSHMVWQDINGEVYDVEGIYDGEAQYFIPIRFINAIHPEYVDSYKHLASNVGEWSMEDERESLRILLDIIEQYRTSNSISDKRDYLYFLNVPDDMIDILSEYEETNLFK